MGQSSDGSSGLADPTGIPFGADAANPAGQSFSYTFQVNGIEGNVGSAAAADDTPATAHNLGDIASQGLIQISGAIGADPFYDPSNPDPLYTPGNQVNLYHFRIDGPGRYALAAEVFAGRIGSLLDPGVSLYWLAPDGHTLDFVAGNNNTNNLTQATDGSTPLAFDAALTAGLIAGDYYIAVSSGWNTPSPQEGMPLNWPGLFDPTVSHSGSIGFGTGPYVLNLLVQPVHESAPVAHVKPGARRRFVPVSHPAHRPVQRAGQSQSACLRGFQSEHGRRSPASGLHRRQERREILSSARIVRSGNQYGDVPDARSPGERKLFASPVGSWRLDRPRRQSARGQCTRRATG